MSYPKAWQKCLNKIQSFTSVPIEQWNYYQLLGYLLSNITQKFESLDNENVNPDFLGVNKTEPRTHPMLESMRYIWRQFDKCPVQTKKFLDWCLGKYGARLNTKGLKTLLSNYRTSAEPLNISIPERTDPLPDHIKCLFSDLLCTTYGELANMRHDEELNAILISKLQSINTTVDALKLEMIK